MKNKYTVSIVKCDSYDKKVLIKSIKKSLDLLGGFEKFIKTDSKILIKPNLLYNVSAETAITTHPNFVEAVIEILIRITSNPKNITIADSPGAAVPYTKEGLKKVYEKTGLIEISKNIGCNLNYNNDYYDVFINKGEVICNYCLNSV